MAAVLPEVQLYRLGFLSILTLGIGDLWRDTLSNAAAAAFYREPGALGKGRGETEEMQEIQTEEDVIFGRIR